MKGELNASALFAADQVMFVLSDHHRDLEPWLKRERSPRIFTTAECDSAGRTRIALTSGRYRIFSPSFRRHLLRGK